MIIYGDGDRRRGWWEFERRGVGVGGAKGPEEGRVGRFASYSRVAHRSLWLNSHD